MCVLGVNEMFTKLMMDKVRIERARYFLHSLDFVRNNILFVLEFSDYKELKSFPR